MPPGSSELVNEHSSYMWLFPLSYYPLCFFVDGQLIYSTIFQCSLGFLISHIERQQSSPPSVIVIGGGISGIAAARALCNASFNVIFSFHL